MSLAVTADSDGLRYLQMWRIVESFTLSEML